MMSALKIITTADGSHSLLNEDLHETYHSTHGALQESLHVFIKNGFDFVVSESAPSEISILEIGFGTGLNALLTVQRAKDFLQRVHYRSLEAFPLEKNVWESLNYGETVNGEREYTKIHEAAWNTIVSLNETFRLLKEHTTLQEAVLNDASNHLIYFDAFAPNKQPEMWDISMLEKTIKSLLPGGVFVTYCAKGQLKRDLKSLGLTVETLAGPPGKKEMVRAIK